MSSRRGVEAGTARSGGAKALQRIGFGALAGVLVIGSLLGTLGLAGVAVAGAAGTDLYASSTGSSATTDACTSTATPCSLTRALTVAASTDTIELSTGIYGGNFTVKATLKNLTLEPKVGTAGATGYILAGLGSDFVLALNGGATVTVEGLTIEDGHGADGGGVEALGSSATSTSLTLEKVTVKTNLANSSGGGIYADHSTLIVKTSTISGNTSTTVGGGIADVAGSVLLTDDTLSGNIATKDGGAVFAQNTGTSRANVAIRGSTLSHNVVLLTSGGKGGTLAADYSTVYLAGSIVAKTKVRVAPACSAIGTGTFFDAGYDVADVSGCGFTTTTPTATHHSVVDAAIDDYLGTLGANGGPTETVPLLGTPSPATTAADPALGNIPKSAAVTVDGTSYTQCSIPDQRGVSRDTAFCDAGSFELTPAPTITSFTPTTGPVTGDTTVTIKGTNLTAATTVKFGTTDGTIKTATSTSTSLVVTNPTHTVGLVKITVDTSHGDVTSTGTFTYAKHTTTTSIALSTTTVTRGAETSLKVTPTVTYTDAGTTTDATSGTVTVTAKKGSTAASALCTDTLSTSSTHCSPTATELALGSYTISATYGGTSTLASSATTVTHTLTVTRTAPTTTLTLSPATDTVTYGNEQTESFTGTVSGPSGTPVPTGTATVNATRTGSTSPISVCTITLATTGSTGNGQCSPATETKLAAGTYSVVLHYDGNATYPAATSTAHTLTVTATATPSATLTLSSTSLTYGNEQVETFTATVSDPTDASVHPSGTATVEYGTTAKTLCTITVVTGSGTCSLTATQLDASTTSYGTVKLHYDGNANYPAATSAAHYFKVTPVPTTLTVSVAPGSVTYGAEEAARLSATVTPKYAAAGDPTGTVEMGVRTQELCTGSLTTGVASCAVTPTELPASSTPYVTAASYLRTGNFLTSTAFSTSNPTLSVTKAATTTKLSVTPVSPSSVTYGDESAAALTVTVTSSTSGTPTGTVRIAAGTRTLCGNLTLTATDAGTITCNPADEALLPGSSSLIATYTGSTDFTASTSPAATLAVTPATSTTSIVVNDTSIAYGKEHTVTIAPTVSIVAPSTATPTGTVTVTATKTGTTTPALAVCTYTLGSAGTSCSPSATALPAGTYTLHADYSGTTGITGSTTSTPHTLTVDTATPKVTLTLLSTSLTYGNESAETFTATVSDPTDASVHPTGKVTVGGYGTTPTALCTITVVTGTGTCSLTATQLARGTYTTVKAHYTGSTNYPSATSTPAQSFSVAPVPTTISVSVSPGSVTYGAEEAARLSATVTPEYAAAGDPTGTVLMAVQTRTLCTSSLVRGEASCVLGATELPASLTPYVTAVVYYGTVNINFNVSTTFSTSTPTLSVTKAATTTKLSVTPSSVVYGDESATTLTVTVTSSTSGTPTGTVRVAAGTTTLCGNVTLTTADAGTITCHPADEALLPGNSSLIATYTGSTDFTASTSPAATLTVTSASSTTSIRVTGTPATYGTENTVTITPTVATTPTGLTPTGTVTVTATAATKTYPVCTYTLGTGTSCSPSATALLAGTYTLDADYSGTTGITGSTTSTHHTLTVDKATPAATLALSSTSLTYGNEGAETFTATVTDPTDATAIPRGTVTVEAGTAALCRITLSGGTGTCSPEATALSGGTTDLHAHYNGHTNFNVVTSTPAKSVTVSAETTKAAIAPSVSTVGYGHLTSVVFTVTVTPRYAGTATGTAAVYAVLTTGKKVTLCTVTSFATGSGTCHTTTATELAASPYAYSIVATYTPTASPADFIGSTSPGAPLTVAKAQSTTTTVKVTKATIDYGAEQTTTFTVEVAPEYTGVPEGTALVSVTASGKKVTVCTVTLAKGSGTTATGTCSVTGHTNAAALALVPDTYEVDAAYTPASTTSNFLPSVATTTPNWTITKAPTTTKVTVAPASVPDGKETTAVVSATVSPEYTGIPTGTVTVSGPGTKAVCTITLATGKGTCSTSDAMLFAPVASYTLTGAYNGDTDFVTSTGTTSLRVTAGATTTTVASSADPVLPGHPVMFTATVAGLSNSPTPTGTVTFSQGTTTLCSKVALTKGAATCTTTLGDAATQTITASYSGDTTHLASTGTYTETVESGYWTAAADGSVYAFGTAGFYGSMANVHLNKPIVGMAATPTGKGYWLVASDGGVFSFGAAHFYGSTGSMTLNKPVVGMAATPTGNGYWLVASDGGVFSFGAANFEGSASGVANAPVTGIAPTPTGKGYWLASANGGIFSYGTASFYGSLGGTVEPPGFAVEGIVSTTDGGGYWLVGNNGGISAFGDAAFDGSLPASDVVSPIVTIAGL